jgi:hypothetical protein
MAAVGHERTSVSEELVQKHLAHWETFITFTKYGIVGVVVLLALMGFFLL